MIKENKEAQIIIDPQSSLNSAMLNEKQLALRKAELTKVTTNFTKSLSQNALSARNGLVSLVFNQLFEVPNFSWAHHANLCIALGDIRTRDGLLRKLHDEIGLRAQVCEHLAREVARAEKPWVAPLATVLGGIVWLAGFPEQTRVAIDRALDCDPSYSLALLLDIALRHNVPASVWSASLEAVSFEACLKGAA